MSETVKLVALGPISPAPHGGDVRSGDSFDCPADLAEQYRASGQARDFHLAEPTERVADQGDDEPAETAKPRRAKKGQ